MGLPRLRGLQTFQQDPRKHTRKAATSEGCKMGIGELEGFCCCRKVLTELGSSSCAQVKRRRQGICYGFKNFPRRSCLLASDPESYSWVRAKNRSPTPHSSQSLLIHQLKPPHPHQQSKGKMAQGHAVFSQQSAESQSWRGKVSEALSI